MVYRPRTNPFAAIDPAGYHGYAVSASESTGWIDLPRQRRRSLGSSVELLIERKRMLIWLLVVLGSMLLLFGRMFYLQVAFGGYYREVAEGNRIRILDVKAPRGIIYDRNHTQLVSNQPTFSLGIIPVDLPREKTERQRIIAYAASLVQEPPEALEAALAEAPAISYQPVVVKESISYEQAVQIRISSSQMPGLVLVAEDTRRYEYTAELPSLSHVLGYLGRLPEDDLEVYLEKGYSFDDYLGRAGLEQTYEAELKGENGKTQIEVDATGRPKEVISSRPPKEGENLVLSLDLDLQRVAETSLRRALTQLNLSRGVVIAMDPRNGEILTLVSLPAYDGNLFTTPEGRKQVSSLFADPTQPLFNRPVSGEYPSGSTFKMVVAAAALQEGVITPSTGFNSVGGIRVSRWFFPDWKVGGHGWTTVVKALAESVNTFFYIIGGGYNDFQGLGLERLVEYAGRFGVGEPLGIDLPHEAGGFLPSQKWKEETKNEPWYIGDTYHLAIGQGDILVTPLQVAAWTTVLANGGTLYRPHLGRELVDSASTTVRQLPITILREHVIDPVHIATVQAGLRETVLSGSARSLGTLPIAVAAKTGTAQWSSRGQPHAWFTAYAPFNDPQLVVTILIEEGEEGSRTALPVAREILEWWIANRLPQPSDL